MDQFRNMVEEIDINVCVGTSLPERTSMDSIHNGKNQVQK